MPPKTGDSTLVWLYVGLFTAAMGSMLFVVGKEYARKRKQAREALSALRRKHFE